MFFCLTVCTFAENEETAAVPHGRKIAVTHKEVIVSFAPGYDKVFYQSFAAGAAGALEFNNAVKVKTGFLFWKNAGDFQANSFVKGESVFPLWKHFVYSAAYIFIALPQYENYSHTILPLIQLRFRPAGIALGLSFRFSEFYDSTIFEKMISFSMYLNFINNDIFRFGVRLENYNDYLAANFGAYWFNINAEFRITKIVKLAMEIELSQSGSIGMSAAYYGVTFRPVMVITW